MGVFCTRNQQLKEDMKRTMIVVADLGTFKTFSLEEDSATRSPRLQPIAAEDFPDAFAKRSNTLTVMEGRSAKSPSNSRTNATASDGEQHNMHLEKRRRSIKKMAANIDQLLAREKDARCFIAAPKDVLQPLLDELPAGVRQRIDRTLPLDLTRTDKSELMDHFLKPA